MWFNGFKVLYFLYLVWVIFGEKGFIIGLMNLILIVVFKGILNKFSLLNNFIVELMFDLLFIWSLVFDFKKLVVFVVILNVIYIFYNFFIW